MSIIQRSIVSTTKERNAAITEFMKSKLQFLVLERNDVKYETWHCPADQVLIEMTKVFFIEDHPYLVGLPGELDRQIISSTDYVVNVLNCPDNIVAFNRQSIDAVGYFNTRFTGPLQMMEYLARINKQAGYAPEHFTCLANCQRYFSFKPLPQGPLKEYKERIEEIRKGNRLRIKTDK